MRGLRKGKPDVPPQAKPKMQAIQVLIDDAHLSAMDAIVAQLKARGFVLVDQLDAIGVLTGRMAAQELARLREVPGVQAVEIMRDDAGPG